MSDPKLMPWEPGYFEQQAAEAAANVGQVVAQVTQVVESATTSATQEVLGGLEDIGNLPPVKNQVTLDPVTGESVTVKTQVGPVTFWDKVKGAYKWLITGVGFLLVVLNQGLAFADVLPQNVANWINVAIAFLTSVSVFLKANEHWVEGIPGTSQSAS